MMSITESRTCSGHSRSAPNKLGIPTLWPCQIPKSQYSLPYFVTAWLNGAEKDAAS